MLHTPQEIAALSRLQELASKLNELGNQYKESDVWALALRIADKPDRELSLYKTLEGRKVEYTKGYLPTQPVVNATIGNKFRFSYNDVKVIIHYEGGGWTEVGLSKLRPVMVETVNPPY